MNAATYPKLTALFTGVIALAIVCYFINMVQPLVLNLLFAYLLVSFFRGTALKARKQFHVPEMISYFLLATAFIGGVTFFTFIVSDTVRDFIRVQDTYKELLGARIDNLETWITQIADVGRVDLRKTITDIPIQPILTDLLNNTVSVFKVLFTFLIFIIAESLENYTRIATRLGIKDSHVYRVMSKFQNNIQQYLVIKTFISAGTATCVYIVLSLFNVDFALLWALLTFLLNYLPVIGSVIATISPMLIIFVTREVGTSLMLMILLTSNQIFWGQFLDPKLVGQEFNLKFKTILVSLFLWGSLLGVGGILVAPLLTLALKLISEEYEDWKWFSTIVSRRHHH